MTEIETCLYTGCLKPVTEYVPYAVDSSGNWITLGSCDEHIDADLLAE